MREGFINVYLVLSFIFKVHRAHLGLSCELVFHHFTVRVFSARYRQCLFGTRYFNRPPSQLKAHDPKNEERRTKQPVDSYGRMKKLS